ncbi:MAG: hypothetical protein E7Z81_05710 [Methanobrevibacter sp.]|jgi:hypothetical protein|uniref:hypothetical protein n=1 Tax=Methanobrevibacter sp. TaxID=66852 RepID=UPI0025EEE711|nr:hypothetical protein [Methanobrevibacter sp.]MBE6497755.1 hypothetical protein [Methanobrevibacter sp.]
MKYDFGINIKALVFGAAIAAAFILFGYQYWDWFYPFSAIGLIYAGYGQDNLKAGTLMGLLASTPIVVLTLQGYMGQFDGFFLTETGIITVTLIILIVGAVVGFVGAWTKRSRVKALEQYEKQQKIGKNKKKGKK